MSNLVCHSDHSPQQTHIPEFIQDHGRIPPFSSSVPKVLGPKKILFSHVSLINTSQNVKDALYQCNVILWFLYCLGNFFHRKNTIRLRLWINQYLPTHPGVYIKLIYIFPLTEIYYNEGVRAADEIFSLFCPWGRGSNRKIYTPVSIRWMMSRTPSRTSSTTLLETSSTSVP